MFAIHHILCHKLVSNVYNIKIVKSYLLKQMNISTLKQSVFCYV